MQPAISGLIVAYALLINLVTFVAYGLDKRAAQRERRRTPERTLHLLAIAGGSPGAYAGQRVFRHKTAKTSFQLRFLGIALLQVFALAVLAYLWLTR